tara:strand:- start:666 stop:770 length:105 start_codon:yes stop_codon:yes gene_type:complete
LLEELEEVVVTVVAVELEVLEKAKFLLILIQHHL